MVLLFIVNIFNKLKNSQYFVITCACIPVSQLFSNFFSLYNQNLYIVFVLFLAHDNALLKYIEF